MPQRVGYARVSTADQSLEAQVLTLREAGCHRVFSEVASGARDDRPELDAALAYLRAGDTLVVWKLDRLGRSLQHLLVVLSDLDARGIHFQSLTEGWDTSTPSGRLICSITGAFAEYERALIRERTMSGLARSTKRPGPKPLMGPEKVLAAQRLLRSGSTAKAASEALGVSRSTLYRALART